MYRDQDPGLAAYTGASVELRRCTACGFAQPDALPALDRYFDRMYDQRWSREWVAGEFESGSKDDIFTAILDALDRRITVRPRRLLDVGAHVGKFLAAAASRGWEASGVEPNPATAAYARERTGLTVVSGGLALAGANGARFHAVTLTDVLEHIPQPLETLAAAASLLEEDGWIAVKVPNGPSQLLKERIRAALGLAATVSVADNLVHVSHFSARALEIALRRTGFVDVDVSVGAPERAASGSSTRARMSYAGRRAVYAAARLTPFGARMSPLAFNLQAYARRPRGHA
jgi:2-polyprenyl-3-methyl-5-hydroxy-6-metoxy-1,4-benzoquinol methylase